MDSLLFYIVLILAAVFIAIFLYRFLLSKFITDSMEREMKEEVFQKRREQYENGGFIKKKRSKKKQKKEKTEAQMRLEARMVGVANKLSPLSRDDIEKTKARLWQAGITMDADAFHAIEVGLRVIGIVVAIYVAIMGIARNDSDMFVICIFVLAVCLLAPSGIIFVKTHERREKIEIDLPTVLEMLSSAVSAGTTIDQGFTFIATKTKGPLALEFGQVDRDVRVLGLKRNDALLAMSARCGVQSVSMFISAVIQATEQGASMSTVLANQARRARDEYYSKMEGRANKIPTKMVFPLALFILPTLFIAILAPIVVSIISSITGLTA